MLVNHTINDRLLGCYLQNPELTIDTKYPLDKEEWNVLFQKILYATIYNLALHGCKSVSLLDITEFVKPYEAEFNVLQDNNYEEYIPTIVELTDCDNFEYYYKEFRKFSCLNEYKERGFDIKKFYDEDKSEESQLENLNQYTIEDIINYFEKQQSDVRQQFLVNNNIEIMTCGDGFSELLNELEKDPMIGAGLCSPIINNLYRGWCKGHLILRGSPSSFGKAQPIDTVIPTPNGNKLLGDIKVGDYVFDRKGQKTKVLNVFPQGIIDCHKVTFSDDRVTYCNDEHIWNIYQGNHTVNKTLKEIVELMEKDIVSIPMCEKVEYEEQRYNTDPYELGKNCVENENYILSKYKYGSIEQRYSLLQGLFDVNGIIDKDNNVLYIASNIRLAKDVKFVLNSLGYICKINKVDEKYILSVIMRNKEKAKLFRLSRYKDIALKMEEKNDDNDIKYISFKSIEKVEPCEMVCIYVDNDEHLYLTNDYIVTHNTCMGISDQNNVSVLRKWSDEEQDFVDNPYYQGKGAYIHTEQKMREEIQPRFMANISGVPYHKILDGDFTKEEKARLEEAGRIAKESELEIINYPTFTANGLKEMIKNLSLGGYEYITFDYCWDNFYIGAELKKISGTAIRQDMSLLHLVDTLKMTAEQYNVAIATMIQLNGKEKEVEIVDESCLFGSRSVKTKLDNGSIYMYPRQKELKQVEPLIAKWNNKNNPQSFGNTIIPNAVSHCFKTRYGRFGQNIKVWHYVDNSIGKMVDMFATTWDNKPIDIPPLYIENKGE